MSLSFARGWKFDQFQTQIPTTRNNRQQGVQTGQYPTMLRPFARGFILLTTRNAKQEIKNKKISHSISTEVSQLLSVRVPKYSVPTKGACKKVEKDVFTNSNTELA